MVNIEYLHLLTPSLPRVGDMNQYESEALPIGLSSAPTNPYVDPAFINILTSFFQKVSMQSIIGEALLTLPATPAPTGLSAF